MHIDLRNKRVIVTGATRGIGQAIASAFAKEGVRLAICARNADAVASAREDYLALGAADVIAVALDVRDTEQVRDFVSEAATRWDGIDVLVNNAGQGKGGDIDTLKPRISSITPIICKSRISASCRRWCRICAPSSGGASSISMRWPVR